MDNKNDKLNLMGQMNQLKDYNDKIKECLSAIQLIAVDDNNSRVKDESLKLELENLSNQVSSMSTSINAIEKNLN